MKLPKHKKALILHATIIKYTLRLSKYFHRKLRKKYYRGILQEEEKNLSIKKLMVLLTECGSDVFLTRNVCCNEMENKISISI